MEKRWCVIDPVEREIDPRAEADAARLRRVRTF
jgi:hypothetical protein